MKYLSKKYRNNAFQNFLFISLYQAVNFIPLILFIPYLTRVVGVDKFGLLALMQTISTFFYVLSDYGFSVTTVRKLAIFKNDKMMVRLIINNTISLKVILIVLSFPLFIGVSIFFFKDQFDWIFVLMGFVVVIGQAFFPTWLCQGLDKNRQLFIANFVGKTILCFVIFFAIDRDTYSLYLFYSGIITLLSGLFLIFYIVKIDLVLPNIWRFSFEDIWKEILEGKEIFFSNFAISVYLSTSILILSLNVSPIALGLFSIADRIMMLLRTILSIFVQAIYPDVCKIAKKSTFKETILYTMRISLPFTIFVFIMCCVIWCLSYQISSFFVKNEVLELTNIFKIMSFIPLFVSLNTVPNVVLFAFDKKLVKLWILLFAVTISLILSNFLVPIYKIQGTIWITFITESFVAVSTIIYLYIIMKKRGRLSLI